ncbi:MULTISPECIES: hypothetical protein [Methylobacter]
MNTNQFLQTARTVTFIIQKNKEEIPGYQSWYSGAVTTPWGCDEVMKWAKDARNKIEKEGDLELNSSLNVTLLFSYLEEEDVQIQCGRTELLNASIKKLVRLAQKKLPSGVADAAAVKIERRWVTVSLPGWELLHALIYVYGRIYNCCKSLAQQFGDSLDSSIPNTSSFDTLRDKSRRVRYIKLNGLHEYSVVYENISIDRKFEPPQEIRSAIDTIHVTQSPPVSLSDGLEFYTKMAELTFSHYGNHVPMLFLFNERWQPIDGITTEFADQADKFIFWRNAADRIASLKASGIVWISESWLRKTKTGDTIAIRNMPIFGEQLHVLAIDKSGNRKEVVWEILRDSETKKPTLQMVPSTDQMQFDGTQYFLVPAMRALGLKDPVFVV